MDNNLISYEEVCSLLNSDNLDVNETSKNLVNNPTILKDKVDENYKFIKKGILFKFFSYIVYVLVFIILFPILWLFYMPKVRGKRNLRKVKNAVFVSNHCFVMDCAILSVYTLPFVRPYIIAEKDSFQIPVVKGFIRSLRAVPIPNNLRAYKKFITSIDNELTKGKSLLVYPEGSLWPYFAKIRPFKSGAFRFSVKNDVPVVPIVISFRKPNWLYRFFGREKPFINVNILEPIYVDKNNSIKVEEERISNLTYKKMQEEFEKTNSYVYINYKRLEKEKKQKIRQEEL